MRPAGVAAGGAFGDTGWELFAVASALTVPAASTNGDVASAFGVTGFLRDVVLRRVVFLAAFFAAGLSGVSSPIGRTSSWWSCERALPGPCRPQPARPGRCARA